MKVVAVVDYGIGNLRSVVRGLERAGAKAVIINDLRNINDFDGVVLPGQGSFRPAAEFLKRHEDKLREAMDSSMPVLGICLGMQLLFTASEEGGYAEGLNVFKGVVKELPRRVKRPHMGWNSIKIINDACPLLAGLRSGTYFYFAHSYYVEPEDRSLIAATTEYGGVEFPSIVWRGNVFGTQFHPEKSGDVGLKVLRSFVKLCGE